MKRYILNFFGIKKSLIYDSLLELFDPGEFQILKTVPEIEVEIWDKEGSSRVDIIKSRFSYNFIGEGKTLLYEVAGLLFKTGKTVATAESCTGGLISNLLTNVPGSSVYLLGGVVSYSNGVKSSLLGVKEETLLKFGAVSAETVKEMAVGVKELIKSDIALSVSGIAGPGGGTPEKPVGTVYFCLYDGEFFEIDKRVFEGNRLDIKFQSAYNSLFLLFHYLKRF